MRTLLVTAISCCLWQMVQAQESESPPASEWAGALTLETISNLQGGIARGTHGMLNLDVTLTIDTQASGWWEGGTWFGYLLGNYGDPASQLTGEFQTLSNIETDNAFKLYEFWYEHSFADDSFKVLVGLHDYNATFYSLDSVAVFSQSSFGIGPDTSQVGPSIFSTTAAAVHFTFNLGSQYVLLAAYDGIPGDPDHPHGTHVQFDKGDGLFKAAEWGVKSEGDYKLGVGGWHHTAEVDNPVDGEPNNGNHGFYLIGERYLAEDLAAFIQYGRADGRKNQLGSYYGLGVVASNLWAEDTLGLGLSVARNGAEFLRANDGFTRAERALELTYQRALTDQISAQASLYHVQHPGMAPELDDALALGFRLYLNL